MTNGLDTNALSKLSTKAATAEVYRNSELMNTQKCKSIGKCIECNGSYARFKSSTGDKIRCSTCAKPPVQCITNCGGTYTKIKEQGRPAVIICSVCGIEPCITRCGGFYIKPLKMDDEPPITKCSNCGQQKS